MKKVEGKFILFDVAEFASWLSALPVHRVIKAVQQHHTYIPEYRHFAANSNAFDHLRSMEYAHLQRGFAEIAQNLTTFPDGTVAVCRSFDKIPAGIKGANKNAICIENLGNFDAGHDSMTLEQRNCIIQVTALLCSKFDLRATTDTILYHHWYDLVTGERTDGTGTTKSCPGTAFFEGNRVANAATSFIPLVEGAMAQVSTVVPAVQGSVIYSAEVTADILNVRNVPSVSGTIIGELRRGVDVQVYGENGDWCQIHPTEQQWVNGHYLGTVASATPPAPPLYGAGVLVGALNVRTLPSTLGRIIRQLPQGTNVSVYEQRGDWCRIHPAESHWVNGTFLGKAFAAVV